MNNPVVSDDSQEESQAHHAGGSLAKLVVGAVGVVFGDIGTSPIYAFRETFVGHHRLIVDQAHIYGVLSLIFWSMMIILFNYLAYPNFALIACFKFKDFIFLFFLS